MGSDILGGLIWIRDNGGERTSRRGLRARIALRESRSKTRTLNRKRLGLITHRVQVDFRGVGQDADQPAAGTRQVVHGDGLRRFDHGGVAGQIADHQPQERLGPKLLGGTQRCVHSFLRPLAIDCQLPSRLLE